MSRPAHLALFFSSFRPGGVERVQINLGSEFLRRGYQVDLVVASAEGELLEQVAAGARIVNLGASRTLAAIPCLARYLQQNRPDALLSAQTHNNCAAVIARRLARCTCRLTISEHSDLNMVIKASSVKEKMRPLLARMFYRSANGIVAVSQGAAEALSMTARIPTERIKTIYNPVVTPQLLRLAEEKPDHPWLMEKKAAVILSVGRLEPPKDYPTLLEAFALVLQKRKSFLIILGEGAERQKLEQHASQLGMRSCLDMPGFQMNPYSFMTQADVFVLSSVREGLPTVLIEALACGTPVVSTNCPSGPAEILENGRFGALVPPGEPRALADAILQTMDHPPAAAVLQKRAADFSVEKIADQYLEVLL